MDGDGVVDLVIKRDGEKIKLDNFELKQREYIDDGKSVVRYGISFNLIEGTFLNKLEYSCYTTWNFVRLIWISLRDLVTGAVGFKDLSGVVGIVSTVNEVGQSAATVAYAIQDIAYLFAFIAINLAVMNMLPIPALDGGRIFFMIITAIIEKIIGRKVNPKYEGYIHSAGLFLLMGLMAVVMISDVVKIFHG